MGGGGTSAARDEVRFQVFRGNSELGRYSLAEIQAHLGSGHLRVDDLVKSQVVRHGIPLRHFLPDSKDQFFTKTRMIRLYSTGRKKERADQ